MASGKINGSVTGTSASKYNFWVEWNSKAYVTENYSLVNATAYLQRNDGYSNSAYTLNVAASSKSITVAGNKRTSTQNGIDTRNSAKVIIATAKNIKVEHDDNGYKSIDISATFPSLGVANLTGGSLSKNVTLDKIDVSLPTFAGKPIVISKISQTSVNVSFSSNDVLDKIEYSIDNKKTWVEVNSKDFVISSLTANTNYGLYVRIRKKSNQKTKTSIQVTFKTLPILIEEIEVQSPLEINVGQELEIPYTIYPSSATNQNLNIESSVSGVLAFFPMKPYKIKALNRGSTILTLKATDGSEVYNTIFVIAKSRVIGIKNNLTKITVSKGSLIELDYTIYPENASDKNVIITSSNQNVVSINGDDVLAVGEGAAVVTIKTVDGGLSTTTYVNVEGEYTWYDFSTPIEVLSVNDLKKIINNITVIYYLLNQKGITVESLNDTNAEKTTQYIEMFDLLQNIEYNLDIISDNNAKSIYYIEPKVVGEYASNKEDIWRWIQILNEMYNILTGDFPKWQYLLCTDGYPTIDDKKILIRGDFVG